MISSLVRKIKKPEYIYQPKKLLDRILNVSKESTESDLIWGHKKFLVNPNETIGQSINVFGFYDLVVCESISRIIQPGDICLDVGANIGVFTSLMSHLGGHVTAFEPHPGLFKTLKKNSETLSHVTLKNIALSDQTGSVNLHIPPNFAGNEGTASLEPSANSHKIQVTSKTLDSLFEPDTQISLMKIDVEGHELSVFKGAESLLKEKAIKHIIFEDFGGSQSENIKYLESLDYTVVRLHKGFFNIQTLNPADSDNLPLWEPPNFLASAPPLDWKRFKSWQTFKL